MGVDERIRVEWSAQIHTLAQEEISRTKNGRWLGVWITSPDRFDFLHERTSNGIEYRIMSCRACHKDPLDCECEVYGNHIERTSSC